MKWFMFQNKFSVTGIYFCEKFEVTIRCTQIMLLLNLLLHLPSYILGSDYTRRPREISIHHP